MILKIDAFNFTLKRIAFQIDKNNLFHFITFYNHKFNSIEINYKIYDKKMLIIIEYINK